MSEQAQNYARDITMLRAELARLRAAIEQAKAERDAAIEHAAKLCESMGALDALDGEDKTDASHVRVADRQAQLCAKAIRATAASPPASTT
jgi:hypothetical protein